MMLLFTQVRQCNRFLQCRRFLAVDQNVLGHLNMLLNGGTYSVLYLSLSLCVCVLCRVSVCGLYCVCVACGVHVP